MSSTKKGRAPAKVFCLNFVEHAREKTKATQQGNAHFPVEWPREISKLEIFQLCGVSLKFPAGIKPTRLNNQMRIFPLSGPGKFPPVFAQSARIYHFYLRIRAALPGAASPPQHLVTPGQRLNIKMRIFPLSRAPGKTSLRRH